MKLALLLAVLLPFWAGADVKLPTTPLPRLPEDGSVCNAEGTYCVVNYDDWMALEAEVKDLRARSRTTQCASVTVTEPSKLTRR